MFGAVLPCAVPVVIIDLGEDAALGGVSVFVFGFEVVPDPRKVDTSGVRPD